MESNLIYRHSVVTRILHWVNALCVFLVLMSGLQIFNAHPRLYWGEYGANADTAFIQIGSGHAPGQKAFPPWATIPGWQDLAGGRRWHFFFAWLFAINGAVYLLGGLVRRHFRRDLLPTRAELAPAHLLHEVVDHAKLNFPKGEAARRYNVLQKLTYMGVAFVLLPLMVLTGLTMSPGLDSAFHILLDVFGGRPSARSIHFICAAAMILVGAIGVIVRSHPVHCALSLILTLFGIAVLFIAQNAQSKSKFASV